MSIKSLPARGMHGWYTNGEEWIKISVDADGKVQITSTDLATVLSEIQSETYGLEAIKDAIEELEADVAALALEATLTAIKGSGFSPSTDTLEKIRDAITALQTDLDNPAQYKADVSKLDNATYGLEALKALIDSISSETDYLYSTALDEGVAALSIGGQIGTVRGIITNAEYGPEALKALIDAIEAKLDSPDDFKADVSSLALEASLGKKVSYMDFWSQNDDVVSLGTGTDVEVLPNVVVAGLPTDCTIVRVVALLKVATIKSSAATPLDNGINSATMTVEVSVNSDHSAGVDCITIPDNSWLVDVSASEQIGGDVIIGDVDIKTTVTDNGTFYFQFDDAVADAATLELREIAVGLRIYFY